jgi:hypothetical protein
MKKVTIKEVKKWMKTLEENRYRKLVHADARRIAWFVNNSLSEDYDSMPESMRKKWVKAEYKKERYMAKKFLESLKQNESVKLNEAQPLIPYVSMDKGLWLAAKKGRIRFDQRVSDYYNNAGQKKWFKDIWPKFKKNHGIKNMATDEKEELALFKKLKSDKEWEYPVNESQVRQLVRETIQDLMESKRVQLILPARERKRADALLKKLKLKSGVDFDYGVGKGTTFIIDLDKKHYNKVLELFISKDIQVRG